MNEKVFRAVLAGAYVGVCIGIYRFYRVAAARENMAMIDNSIRSHMESWRAGYETGFDCRSTGNLFKDEQEPEQ